MADQAQLLDNLKYLLISASPEYRDSWYQRFVTDLEKEGIPFDHQDPKFRETLARFVARFKESLLDAHEPESKLESLVPKETLGPLIDKLDHLPESIARVKRERIEEITREYVTRLRHVVGRVTGEAALVKNLTDRALEISKETKDPGVFAEKLTQGFVDVAAATNEAYSAQIRAAVSPVAKEVVEGARDKLPGLVSDPPKEALRLLVESPTKRKDLWLDVFAVRAGRETRPNIDEVNRLALVAEALEARTVDPNAYSPTVFFQNGAKGLQKPLSILADTMLTVFPKSTRDAVIESITRRGWEVATRSEKLSQKVGAFVTQSALFQEAIEKGNQVFGAGQPLRAVAVKNAISDVTTALFGRPQTIDDLIALAEFGILRKEYITNYQRLYLAGAYGRSPALFNMFFSEAAGWGIQKATKGFVVRAGAKVGGGALGRFIGGLAGSLVGGIFGTIAGFFGGGLLASLFGRRGPGEKPKWYDDPTSLGFVLALVGGTIVGIFALAILMFVNNTASFQESQIGGGYGGGPIIDCLKTPTDPHCTLTPCATGNCPWPVSGYITQGPYAQCNDTHQNMNAVDIGTPYGTPVYSITDGTIVDIQDNCADTTGGIPSRTPHCNSGWGNYVDIQAPSGAVIRYAHLSKNTIDQISVGQSVTKGKTSIGTADNNGSSTGNHLHVGIQSGSGSILDLLPLTKEQAQKVLGCSTSRGCPACPVIQTAP